MLTVCAICGKFARISALVKSFVWFRALVLGALSVTAMLAVADHTMLRSLPPHLARSMQIAAQIGSTVPAIGVIVCLLAITRPGPAAIPTIPLLAVAVGALAGVVLVAALVAQDISAERHRAILDAEAAEARAAEARQRFATLTDADPLLAWDEFVHANVPADLAAEALRRLSVRPTLERDLTEAFGCDCRNPLWTAELRWLVGAIPFEPSANLSRAVHEAISALAAHVRDSAEGAYADQRATYVDLYFARELDTVCLVAVKFARSAKVDLRPALQEMRRAVVEAYPRSQAASRFRAEIERAEGDIIAILRGR